MSRPENDDRPIPPAANRLELRFEVGPEQIRRIRSPKWIQPLQTGRTTTHSLRTIDFDTPGRHLSKRGLTLQLRREGRGFVQSVRACRPLKNALLAGDTWTMPTDGESPDLAALLTIQELATAWPKQARDQLQPVFESVLRQTRRRLLTPEGSEIEWALELGELRTETDTAPLRELVLKLVSGPPGGLFTLAHELLDWMPLRLLQGSQTERGHSLETGEPPRWHRARAIRLEPQATSGEALSRTLSQCLEQLAANEACLLARAHVEGVHQMRVALRRLRSALSLFRQGIPEADFERLDSQARHGLSLLGAARDWDVFLTETLAPIRAWIREEPALDLLHAQAERNRERAYAEAQAMVTSADYGRTRLDVEAWIREQSLSVPPLEDPESLPLLYHPAIELGRKTLEKRHRKLIKSGKHLATLNVAERHQLRIAVKKQRYATEFFASLFPARKVRNYNAHMVALQTHLGLLNDIATAERLTHELVAQGLPDQTLTLAYSAGLVVGWLQQELRRHETALLRDWDEFKSLKTFW